MSILITGIGLIGRPPIVRIPEGQFTYLGDREGSYTLSRSADFMVTFQSVMIGFQLGVATWACISQDGKYVLISYKYGPNYGTGALLLSTDGGLSFTPIIDTTYSWNSCAMSNSGKYMYATDANYSFFYSSNYGATWNRLDYFATWVSCDGSGLKVLVSNSNNAARYSLNGFSSYADVGIQWYAGSCTAVSNDGSTWYVAVPYIGLYKSQNNWASYYDCIGAYGYMTGLSANGDSGMFVTIDGPCTYYFDNASGSWNFWSADRLRVFPSGRGNFIVATDRYYSNLYISVNGGASWTYKYAFGAGCTNRGDV